MERAHPSLERWLSRCLRAAGREVWDCDARLGGDTLSVVVTLYGPSGAVTQNSSLPPVPTARTCALALQEMPVLGVPTPNFLGFAAEDRSAAVVAERPTQAEWGSQTRVDAARALARLHAVPLDRLSPELRRLVEQSDPKQRRTLIGLEMRAKELELGFPGWRERFRTVAADLRDVLRSEPPSAAGRSLVHGDYFSANVVPTADGPRVIDWETLALGDPMWDLAFLIGADRDLDSAKIAQVVGAYADCMPIDAKVLTWHRRS